MKKPIAALLLAVGLMFAGVPSVLAQDPPVDLEVIDRDTPSDNEKAEPVAPTPEPKAEPKEDPGSLVKSLVEAVKSKSWPLVAGLVLMLLVFAAGKLGLKDKIRKRWLPWLGVGLSMAGAIGLALMTDIPWTEALGQGFLAGAAASGLWELLKSLFKKEKETA